MTKLILRAGLFLVMMANLAIAGNLTVHEVLHRALTSHPRAEIAKAVTSEARGSRMAELSPSSPTVALEYEGIPRGSTLSDYEERRLTISQELDFPLHILWHSATLNATVEQARLASDTQLLDLEMDVRLAYLNTWANQEREKILKTTVTHLEAMAAKIERMAELGESALLEARSARVAAILAKNEYDVALREHSASLKRLQSLAGFDLNEAELESPLIPYTVDEFSTADSVSINSNPEVDHLRAEVRAAGYENLIAATGWLPELEIAYFQQKFPAEFDSDFWGVELGISVPLWFWWGGRGEILQTRARKRIAEYELSAYQLELASTWNEIYSNYQSEKEKNRIYERDLVPLAEETAQLAEKSYSMGEATYLEVLEAMRSYNEILLERLESSVDLYEIITEMDRLTGHSLVKDEK